MDNMDDTLDTAKKFSVTIEALTDVLDIETVNACAATQTDLCGYLGEKTRLLANYAADMEALKTHMQKSGQRLPDDLRIKLKTQSMRLVQAMERNRRALDIAQSASQYVVNAIIKAVKNQRQENVGYGLSKKGNLVMSAPAMGIAQAVTLDERL